MNDATIGGIAVPAVDPPTFVAAALGTGEIADPPTPGVQTASAVEAISGWRSAVFSGRKLGSLGFDFSRDVPSVDPLGVPVGSGEPRYANSRLVVQSNPWSVAVEGTSDLRIYGSGWDHDGSTPLALVNDLSSNELIFYRGDAFEVANRVQYAGQGSQGLLRGTVPGFRYSPRAAIVYEGLIVIEAQRDRLAEDVWTPEGITFLYTQDYGVTLTRVPQVGGGFDVPPIDGGVADGMTRGRNWAFANAFPERSTDDLLGVWFPWADYLHNPGSPKGGQIGLFRARRSAVGEPWLVEPNKLVYERWQTEDSGGHHAHSAGMLRDGMASFWGDVGFRNMMVRHVASDLENYTADVWTNIEEFQGAWSPDDARVYKLGNQAASAAPGPAFGEILTTGDVQPELIMKVQSPARLGEKARITSLKGSTTGETAGSLFEGRLSLSIHRLRDRGYVVAEKNTSGFGGQTIHYSMDGEQWASMPAATDRPPFLYGDQILQEGEGNLFVADRPSASVSLRPLIVNPGGTNLANETWQEIVDPAAGWTYRSVTLTDGVYTYADDGTLLDPQPESVPPVMDQMPIWEITTDGSSGDGGVRQLSGTNSDRSQHHWLTTWQYSLDGDGIEPSYKFGNFGAGNQTSIRATRWVANTQWVPSFLSGVPSSNGSLEDDTLLWVFDGTNPAPRRWLMVGEGYVQGDAPTYPLQPGSAGPNEAVVIDGFQAGSEWTVAMTFGLPQVSAFSSRFDTSGADTIRPIATIYEESDNYAEIYYTKANNTLWIDVYSRKFLIQKLIFPGVTLDIQDKVSLVISSTDDQFAATLQVVRGSYPITHQVQTGNGSIRPRRIYLSNTDQSVVSPLEWYAVQINESVALDAEQRESLIMSDQMFRVLDAGGLMGDMNLDGVVDFDDIADFVFGLSDAQSYLDKMTVSPAMNGDGDGDGDVDFDDVDEFVAVLASLPTRLAGDMDLDVDVDFDDIDEFVGGLVNPVAYVEQFGISVAYNGDMDGDDDLDFDDIRGFVEVLSGGGAQAVFAGADPTPWAAGEQDPPPVTERVLEQAAAKGIWVSTVPGRSEVAVGGWLDDQPLSGPRIVVGSQLQ
ncbi:MAG: hypothetical protein ACC628_07860 [Pirellulaceae bacterium]